MNKIEKIRKKALDEALKAGIVILGAVGGVAIIKGIRKLTESSPSMDAVAEYALPILFAGGGIVIAVVTDANSKAKYLGYGLAVAGGYEGIKISPAAREFLGDITSSTEIPAATAFLTENEEREKLMSGFGLSALPVANASIQEAQEMDTRLPELEGATTEQSEDLGYNPSQTEDADDMKGII